MGNITGGNAGNLELLKKIDEQQKEIEALKNRIIFETQTFSIDTLPALGSVAISINPKAGYEIAMVSLRMAQVPYWPSVNFVVDHTKTNVGIKNTNSTNAIQATTVYADIIFVKEE